MEQDLLTQYLSDRDAECPVCGYNLRGLTTTRCSECGVPIELTVSSPDLRIPSWITGIIAVSTVTGFYVLVIAFLLINGIRDSMPPLDESWPVYTGAALGSLMLAGLIVGRRRFHRLSMLWRWSLNAACATLLLGLWGIWYAIVM